MRSTFIKFGNMIAISAMGLIMMSCSDQSTEQQAEASAAESTENMEQIVTTANQMIKTASGLKYEIIQEGTGASPEATDMVTVHYEGTLLDGTKFDSSYDRGQPAEFPLNRVIPGWTEGVQLMKEGATYKFLIPSELAYGERGTPGGPIGPNEDLIFTVELIRVN
jgi:FKBP-type peptidyl-prolyl cis-trans isomerase FkpA